MRRAAGFVMVALMTVILAACSSGSAREAERSREGDGTAESVVSNRQATYTATLVAQGTPTPLPERPPRVAALVLTTQVNGDGSPVGEYASVPSNAGTVYLAAQLTGLREGRMAAALRDTSDQHNVLAYNEIEVRGGSGSGWVAIPVSMDGSIPPGDYPIWIIFDPGGEDEEWLFSLVFTVGSAGSGAQRVGDGGNLAPREASDQGGNGLSPGNQPATNSSGDDQDNSDGGEDGDQDGDSPPIQPRD